MRLTAEDNPETIKRYAHLRPAGGWRAQTCAARCPQSPRTCERERGHRGPHASHGWLGRVLAVWTDSAGADVALQPPVTDRRPPGGIRRARTPIGLRNRGPAGVLAGIRDLVSHVASSMEELVWLVFAVAFTVLAIGGFLLITLG